MPESPTPSPSPGPPIQEPPVTGGTGNTPETNDANQKATPYDRLRILLRRRRSAVEAGDKEDLQAINRRITKLLNNHPNNTKLWEEAEDSGFNVVKAESKQTDESQTDAADNIAEKDEGFQGGGSGGGGGAGGSASGLGKMAKDNRLLGDLGKSFTLVKGPKGTYVAKYRFKIDGRVIDIGIRLGNADQLSKYGLNASDAKEITKAQMKQIRRIGNADELAPHMRKGDDDVFDSLVRYIENQYEGQPILRNKGVMSKIIANSMFGWSSGEFENQLRNTSWYKDTNDWQRNWQTVSSPKEKKDLISSTRQQVINALESHYGFEYLKFVEGGVETVNRWAEQISAGRWGTPDAGFKFWSERQFDRAAKTEGTPAWIENQKQAEATNAFNNRPKDMEETLRSQAMDYLGQVNGKPLIPNDTLKSWATDLVTGTKSQSDWQQYLRQQMRALHPYFDENQSFTSQAGAYKSTAESLFGTTLTWDDPLMKKIAGTDDKGMLTGTPMALHDFEQYIRDNDARFWDNPDTENKGLGFLSELNFRMTGAR